MGNSEELVGVREAARQLGVDPSTISRNVAAGIIPNHGTNEAPRINVEEARRCREAFLDPNKRGSHAGRLAGEDEAAAELEEPAGDAEEASTEPDPRAGALRDAKTEIAQTQAELARIQLEEKRGQVGKRADFEAAGFDAGRALRDGLLIMCDEVAPDLARLDRSDACAEFLRAEVLKRLEQFAAKFRAQAAGA
jgi:hypothetical protein